MQEVVSASADNSLENCTNLKQKQQQKISNGSGSSSNNNVIYSLIFALFCFTENAAFE